MQTSHTLIFSDARSLGQIPDSSIDLVVTSPPYPAIQMWDAMFRALASDIADAMDSGDDRSGFEAMHRELDKAWSEVARVLKDGGFVCVNVGDAVRGLGGRFQLFPNHARVIAALRKLRLDCLPAILWRKQTNAPNKFMGSGMLPAGAYVTLEHEYILIFRKGLKREFETPEEKRRRMESAYFWEERNQWFSDVWDFKGARQDLGHDDLRKRSGAFPFELPFRLINMYSLQGDTVLDPFVGTGTTILAAVASARNSIGVEWDAAFAPVLRAQILAAQPQSHARVNARISDHLAFVKDRAAAKGPLRHRNVPHGFPVVTRQETGMRLVTVASIRQDGRDRFIARHRTADAPDAAGAAAIRPAKTLPANDLRVSMDL